MKSKNVVSAVAGTICKIAVSVLVILLVYKGAMFGYEYGYRIFTETAVAVGEGRTVTVTVPEGMSASAMGQMLLKQGLIRDKNLFVIQYYLSEYRKEIKPGTYELSTAMTADEMLKAMSAGTESSGQ